MANYPRLSETLPIQPAVYPDPKTSDWSTISAHDSLLPVGTLALCYPSDGWRWLGPVSMDRISLHPYNLASARTLFDGMQSRTYQNEAIIVDPESHFLRLNSGLDAMLIPKLPDLDFFQRIIATTVWANSQYRTPYMKAVRYGRPRIFPIVSKHGVNKADVHALVFFEWAMGIPEPSPNNALIVTTDHFRGAPDFATFKVDANYIALAIRDRLKVKYQESHPDLVIKELWFSERDHLHPSETTTSFVFVMDESGCIFHAPLDRGTFLKSITFRHICRINERYNFTSITSQDVSYKDLSSGRLLPVMCGNIGGLQACPNMIWDPLDVITHVEINTAQQEVLSALNDKLHRLRYGLEDTSPVLRISLGDTPPYLLV